MLFLSEWIKKMAVTGKECKVDAWQLNKHSSLGICKRFLYNNHSKYVKSTRLSLAGSKTTAKII